MHNLAIRLKIFITNFSELVGYRTSDPLNQRQTCYHLSQRGAKYLDERVTICYFLNKLNLTERDSNQNVPWQYNIVP